METRTLDLKIEGMSCKHCVRAVRGALEGVNGVTVEHVGVGEAKVAYDPRQTDEGQILHAVAEEGYRPHPTHG